jgi:ABC-type branched-subunit amino acid transport system substrate-binding protein/Tfp pilus assembly protein PilF
MPEENGRKNNPYIIGRPIHEPERFFGRESLFSFIEDNLIQGVQVILLHGQRRIGKSSVLQQIPNFVRQDEFVFVKFDLQDKSQSSLSNILHNLARSIVEQLHFQEGTVIPPTEDELESNLNLFFNSFLVRVYQKKANKKLVLLLDEFDVVSQMNTEVDIINLNIVEHGSFFPYLKKVLSNHPENFFIIPVVGRYLNDLPNILTLFKDAPFEEIGLLDKIGTNNLISKPAENILIYPPKVVDKILQLSAGHPYFTQVICSAIFEQARQEERWTVQSDDVENILGNAIEKSEAALQSFWDVLTISERVIVSAIAKATKIGADLQENTPTKLTPEELLTFLKKNGVVQTEYLVEAVEKLTKNVCLYDAGFKIRAELVRRWLVRKHPLKDEIWELNTIEQEDVNSLQQIASRRRHMGKQEEALQLDEEALAINPNNFNTVLSLADKYLQRKNFSRASELYRRAYKADPEYPEKSKYLDALSEYGHNLITQGEFGLAKSQYEQILEIDPNRASARERLKEIKFYENRGVTPQETESLSQSQWRRNFRVPILPTILAILTFAASAIAIALQTTIPCPSGQQRQYGLICLKDTSKISRGDRTLFPRISNPNRDQGIQAVKQTKYREATQLFKLAVADSRNDPEVLIYYNNARARQNAEPFTLAAVVPADNNTNFAQEMLRGVAQAQHEFNEKGGLNGRLLEIIIANDAGEPKQAKEVAAEFVANMSILGVIGHYSSESTKAALEEYNKTEIPVISPSSSSIFLQGNNFFRSLPSDAASAQKLAEYAFHRLNVKKVAIFSNPESSYSNSMREEFTKTFEKLGGEVVRKPLINLADAKLDAEKEVPRSIYRYQAEAALLIPDARNTDAGMKVALANKKLIDRSQNQNKRGLKLLGGDTLYSDQTLTTVGNATEGLILVVPWFREAPQAKSFAQKAARQWGGGVSWRTATSFDATQALIQALSINPTRSTVIQNLKNVKISTNNTSGDSLQFTEERERQTEPILLRVENGKFVPIQQH